MTKPALTDRQREVLDFINEFRAREQKPPTRAEISRHFGFASANAAQEHLYLLAIKGYVLLHKGEARGIFVVPDTSPLPMSLSLKVG